MAPAAAALLALSLLASGCPPLPPPPPPPTAAAETALQLELLPRPLYLAPQLTWVGQRFELTFHINIRNRSAHQVQLQRVMLQSRRGEQVLSSTTLEAPLLAQRLRPAPWVTMRDRQTIAAAHRQRGLLRRVMGQTKLSPQQSVSLSQLMRFQRPAELPTALRVTVQTSGSGTAVLETPVERFRQRTRLTLPVQGRWWVMAGHGAGEHHGSGILDSQNFAYDLGRVGPGQSTCSGDPRQNRSYLASGRPILAAADGVVVAVHDGVKENAPVGVRPGWQSILRQPLDLGGNHVVLRHQGNEHSAYLHLQPGLPLRPGDHVRRGQVVGRCGNSGNSLETHLHFQLQLGPDPLKAPGVPARFGDFTVHLAHLKLYVPAERPAPLPVRFTVEAGRSPGAVDLYRVLGR